MSWHLSPLGRWHYLDTGSIPGYRSSACGAWSPTDDDAARAYVRHERPDGACENCARLTRAGGEDTERRQGEARRWAMRRKRAALAAAVESGTTQVEAARELGIGLQRPWVQLAKGREGK